MTDTQKLLRLYTGEVGIRAMAGLGAVGLVLAAIQHSPETPGLLALGWGLYLLEEHLIHRFVFHLPAPRHQFLFDALYRLHYGHHDQDRNPHLLFTPLWFSLPITLATVAILSMMLPVTDALIAVLGGSVCGYLLFEWLHLTSHARMSSKGRLGRYVTRRHAKHHYIDYTNWYTVSPGGEFVDTAFGADPARSRVVANVRTCGLEPHDPRFVRSRLRFGSDDSLAHIAAISMPAPSERIA